MSRYSLEQSPLYRLNNKRRLAELLGCTVSDLKKAARSKQYQCFDTHDKYESRHKDLQHKPRRVEAPRGELEVIQRRLAELLSRIATPDYLQSAKKNCSYRTNAELHVFGRAVARIDIRKFYPSIKAGRVGAFFTDTLKCGPDVAYWLTELTCLDDRLPTGSSLSPYVSYWACKPMFDELHQLAVSRGLQMTVYVDDVVVSGSRGVGSFVSDGKAIVAAHGFFAHKLAVFRPGEEFVVTGVRQSQHGMCLPHPRFRRIRALTEELRRAKAPARQALYLRALIGQYREATELLPVAKERARHFDAALARLGPQGITTRARRRKGQRLAREKIRARLLRKVTRSLAKHSAD
jgi:RNA-directed DNA polymerase